MVGFIAEHRKHPNVSLQEHYAQSAKTLATFALARHRVYLDTRYWVFLRDAALGRPRIPIHSELLELLRRQVQCGAVICPLGDSTFFELLKQTDTETRMATVRLIDELSLGVTIQNAKDRLQTELLQFLINTAIEKRVPGPPIDRVWLKLGHVLGIPVPVFEGVSAEEQLAISKSFFDVMWSVTLEEQLTDTPIPEHPDEDFETTAARITAASKAHASEIGSFQELYQAEIDGFFDGHNEELREAFAQFHRTIRPNEQPAAAHDFESADRVFVNVFSNVFRFGKAGTSLPTAQIVAGVHAIARWHKERPFRSSDFYDIYHATAALPYCDVFLTERFLGTALSRPPLDLARHFGTTVLWDEMAALDELRRQSE